MLNYISAELYKVFHRTYFYRFTVILLVCVALFHSFFIWGLSQPTFAEMVGMLPTTMPVGLYLTLVLADLVFSGQHKHHTLKNEISFGIPRARVYLGKFCAELILGLLILAAVLIFSLGLSLLLAVPGDPAANRTALQVLAYVVAASLPLWLGTLSLVHLLFFLIKSESVTSVVFILFFTVGPAFLSLMCNLTSAVLSQLATVLLGIFPISPFFALRGALDADLMARTWLTGLGWLILTMAAGLILFRKREC